MEPAQIITIVFAFLGMAGGIIGIYVKSAKEIALLQQEQQFHKTNETEMKNRVTILEKRVTDIEGNMIDKIDLLTQKFHEFEVNMYKILNKNQNH